MDIHKPKPIHNWREFLKEIGTIVIGVLIALAAEQVAEAVHWHNQVAEAREVIATELAANVANGITRMRLARCVERRLDTLAQVLDTASQTGALPPVGDIGQPPLRQWPSGAWGSVVASQTATHFPRQQLAELATLYGLVQKSDDANKQEMEAWTDLHAMVGSGRRLDPASEAALRASLGRARYYNRINALTAVRMIDAVKKQNMPFSKDDLEPIALARRETANSPRPGLLPVFPICGPISNTVPTTYGQAPMGTSLPVVDRALKNLSDFASP